MTSKETMQGAARAYDQGGRTEELRGAMVAAQRAYEADRRAAAQLARQAAESERADELRRRITERLGRVVAIDVGDTLSVVTRKRAQHLMMAPTVAGGWIAVSGLPIDDLPCTMAALPERLAGHADNWGGLYLADLAGLGGEVATVSRVIVAGDIRARLRSLSEENSTWWLSRGGSEEAEALLVWLDRVEQMNA
jgi:hypothetical protein